MDTNYCIIVICFQRFQQSSAGRCFGSPLRDRFLRLDLKKKLGLVITLHENNSFDLPLIGIRGHLIVAADVTNVSSDSISNIHLTLLGDEVGRVDVSLDGPLGMGETKQAVLKSKRLGPVSNSNYNIPIFIEVSCTRSGVNMVERRVIGYSDYRGWSIPERNIAEILDLAKLPSLTVDNIANEAAAIIDKTTSPTNLDIARIVFNILAKHNVGYHSDPPLPIQDKENIVHSVQLPAETIYYGGDCEDLSLLYNSILLRLGIKAGFLDIPRYHVLSAVPLDKRLQFMYKDSTITDSATGKVFLPVDLTDLAIDDASFDGAIDGSWRKIYSGNDVPDPVLLLPNNKSGAPPVDYLGRKIASYIEAVVE